MSANGSVLGEMAYTWDVARDLKLGRVVRSEGGLASSLGYTARYDAVQRMTGASTGRGSTEGGSQGVVLGRWSYAYGQADELVSITEATGGVWQYASGAEGRITSRSGPDGSEAFAYDGEGRRSEDASSRYTWDWRGRLVQVDIKDGAAGLGPALTPHAGERIVYAYNATGRLLSRTHLGKIPPGGTDSDRPFIAKRAFVWDGQRLAAEAGLNFQDQPLWRQQYVPGQRGLDDAPQVRIEKDLQGSASTETYAILRDEMGTPVAVVEEAQGPGSGGRLRLLVRYLSAPYGQRHSELGPELVAIEFDATITKVASTDQRPTANQTVAGALRIVTTSPLASASLASGLVLEQWDAAAASWQTAPRTDFAIGTADDDSTDLRVMRLAGWAKATRYRITLLPSITDTFGRGLILPEGESQGVVVELAVPEDGTTPPSYARSFALAYDTNTSETLGGAFPGGQTSGFQGAWTDPVTGLAYHRARWYDAANATWLSEDPLQDIDSPNLYAFVRHNPLMLTDPWGREAAPGAASPCSYPEGDEACKNPAKNAAQTQGDPAAKETTSLLPRFYESVEARPSALDVETRLWFLGRELAASAPGNAWVSSNSDATLAVLQNVAAATEPWVEFGQAYWTGLALLPGPFALLDLTGYGETWGFKLDSEQKNMGPHLHYGPYLRGSRHPKFHFGPLNPNFGKGRFTWWDWFKGGMPWRWK